MESYIAALLLITFLIVMSNQKIQIQDESIEDMQMQKREDYFSKN